MQRNYFISIKNKFLFEDHRQPNKNSSSVEEWEIFNTVVRHKTNIATIKLKPRPQEIDTNASESNNFYLSFALKEVIKANISNILLSQPLLFIIVRYICIMPFYYLF
eukprot:gene10752-7480_t